MKLRSVIFRRLCLSDGCQPADRSGVVASRSALDRFFGDRNPYEETACCVDCLGVRVHRVRAGAEGGTGGPEGPDRRRNQESRAGDPSERRDQAREGREESQRREKRQRQSQGQGQGKSRRSQEGRSQEVSFTQPSSPAQSGLFFALEFFLLRLFLPLMLAFATAAYADENDWRVPFITTPGDVVERMLELAGTRAGDLVADLGSGDGRIVIAAARRYGARGLGIELDAELVAASRKNAAAAGVADRVSIVQGDVLTADFSQATVVTVYLLPDLIGKLEPRFMSELKPGTRIVSHSFRMASWRPDRTETMRVTKPHPGQGDESTLYLWIVPADVRGTWTGGGRRLRIEQNYQQIEVDGVSGTLSGNEISWSEFRGRVQGERIVGEDGLVLTRER